MTRPNRDLAKFKYFLTSLQEDAQEEQQRTAVNQLIVMLVSSEITHAEFYSRIQNLTSVSLEEFHLNLIKTGLPLLQDELNTLVSISQGCNGHSSPLLRHSISSQEYGPASNALSDGELDPVTPDVKPVKRVTSLNSTMSELEDSDYSITKRTSEVSLKHSGSPSRLEADNVESRMHKLVRLARRLMPLLQEFTALYSEALPMEISQKEGSESESNDSPLYIAENDCYEYVQPLNGFDTPQEAPLTPCANCNRSSVFSCVCQTVSYCSTFCRDKNRETHRRDCFETSPSSSSMQTLTLPQAIYIDRPHHPNIITIQNGNATPMNTSDISPSVPVYLQAIELPISSPATTPVCSISQH